MLLASFSPKMKSALILLLAGLALSGCVPFWKKNRAPGSTERPIEPHETWCYKTMGETQCFSAPQNLPPDSLVMVDPPSRYPVNREEYQRALAEAQGAEKTKEIPDVTAPAPLRGSAAPSPIVSGPSTPPGDLSSRR